MKKNTIIFCSSLALLSMISPTQAEQYSLSPSTLAKKEMLMRDRVNWQTGCAIPDMSDAESDGSVDVNVFVNPDGSTKKIELENSSGTTAQDEEILATLKTCTFTDGLDDVTYPQYFYKTLHFVWRKGDKKPLVGLRKCMRLPSYPAVALSRRIEGTTEITVQPENAGTFTVKVHSSSGSEILDKRSMQIVDKCISNTIIAESIRNNFTNGESDKMTIKYQLSR